jgi:phosphatidylserine decarboxylase
LSKFEKPSGRKVGDMYKARQYTITPEGVHLSKGEEIGMFLMGSTVALVFECPKDYDFKFEAG